MRQSDYLDLFCNTADGVFVTDAHQRIVRWNQGAERILGYPGPEALDRSCFQVICGKPPGGALPCGRDCAIHRSGLEGAPRGNFDLEAIDRAGRPVWLNVTLLSSAGSEPPFVTHILRDVTRDRKRTLALERFLAEMQSPGAERTGASGAPLVEAPGGGGGNPRPECPSLSAREIEVLTLLAEGLSTKELARKLGISHFTARNHIQNILVKLGLHSKAQAVSFAFKQGIL